MQIYKFFPYKLNLLKKEIIKSQIPTIDFFPKLPAQTIFFVTCDECNKKFCKRERNRERENERKTYTKDKLNGFISKMFWFSVCCLVKKCKKDGAVTRLPLITITRRRIIWRVNERDEMMLLASRLQVENPLYLPGNFSFHTGPFFLFCFWCFFCFIIFAFEMDWICENEMHMFVDFIHCVYLRRRN